MTQATRWRGAPDGSRVVVVDVSSPSKDDQLGRFQVTCLGTTGDTIYSRSFSYKARKLAADRRIDSIRTRLIGNLTNSGLSEREAVFEADRALNVPRYEPPVSAMATGPVGAGGHHTGMWPGASRQMSRTFLHWYAIESSGIAAADPHRRSRPGGRPATV